MCKGKCAKRVVTATIIAADGERFVGTNACFAPQRVCPRGSLPGGVGYEMCRDICLQPAHAEEEAIALAGDKARGARMYVEGIDWICEACMVALNRAGLHGAFLEAPPHE